MYRRRIQPTDSLLTFAVYVSFFPQLVAGPIERAHHLLPQFQRVRPRPDRSEVNQAGVLILQGLFKKVVVADGVAPIAQEAFETADGPSSLVLALGVYAFALQIYGDFSGYTDIPRGSARLLGVDLRRNFESPYLSRSITEFWRRWHISLSDWLRDYLYIPLGGNRGTRWHTRRNLMITMLLGGLWHGAAWTFVVWGALHGVFLAAHRATRRSHAADAEPVRASDAWRVLGTFHLVCFAWIFFWAADFEQAVSVLRGLGVVPPPGRVGRRVVGDVDDGRPDRDDIDPAARGHLLDLVLQLRTPPADRFRQRDGPCPELGNDEDGQARRHHSSRVAPVAPPPRRHPRSVGDLAPRARHRAHTRRTSDRVRPCGPPPVLGPTWLDTLRVITGRLPDFLIIGAPKAGTTTLTSDLSMHPEVWIPPRKELFWFGSRGMHEPLDTYAEHFADAPSGVIVGEATPNYLHKPGALEQIADALPAVRLMASLRDPVQRFWSHYWYERLARRAEQRSPDDVIADLDARYVDPGMYGRNLRRAFSLFDRHQIQVLLLDDLRADPVSTFHSVCDHLSLSRHATDDVGRARNTAYAVRSLGLRSFMRRHQLFRRLPGELGFRIDQLNRKPFTTPPMSAEQRAALERVYADDIEELAALLDRPLPWQAAAAT